MNRNQLLQQLMENLQSMYRGMQHKSDFLKEGIPFGQKAALFTITVHGATNVKQLASLLHVTSGAATQHVEALVQEGLVERTTDANDRRNVIIVLSAKGKSLMKKLEQNRLTMLEALFSDITDQELTAYVNVMEKVNHKLN
jgi:DNA-binding MarR family transcriptional regulator